MKSSLWSVLKRTVDEGWLALCGMITGYAIAQKYDSFLYVVSFWAGIAALTTIVAWLIIKLMVKGE